MFSQKEREMKLDFFEFILKTIYNRYRVLLKMSHSVKLKSLIKEHKYIEYIFNELEKNVCCFVQKKTSFMLGILNIGL